MRTHSATQFVVVAVIAWLAIGCGSSGNSPTTKPADDILKGKVLSQSPPPGQVGIENWRFQPDNCPTHYLRLTRAKAQEAVSPESKEIKLDPWAGKRIEVRYQVVDENWVWGAEVVTPRS